MEKTEKEQIKSFQDLEVYQNSYKASINVMKRIINQLPEIEKNDLRSQMSRSCKAIPRLIAEGFAKKHQKKAFQKYLDDSRGESNEMIVCLSHCRDLYDAHVDADLCEELLDAYDKTSRQLYNLSLAWTKFNDKSKD
ncbi:MAG: four helix bundle protein [Thermoplasmata archaeon]|nr:MAG: four helix bundle protein [Thermoplasmata archaeon]